MPRWYGTQNTVSLTDGHSPVANYNSPPGLLSMSVEWVDDRVGVRRYTSIQLRHYCKCRAHTQSNCFCLLLCRALTAVKPELIFQK